MSSTEESSSKNEVSHSHPPLQSLRASAKKQFKREAKPLAKPLAFGRGKMMSGIGQSSLSHWTRAKEASVSGFSLTIEDRRRAAGVASKTNADGNGNAALFLQRLQISSSISSKQWRHLPAGSGREHSSQHSGQKRRVSHISLQERHIGGNTKSIHASKRLKNFTTLKIFAFSGGGIADRPVCRRSKFGMTR